MDECIGRGCGGLILGVEVEEHDGSVRVCSRCRRWLTFHTDGESWRWTIERKPRPKRVDGA
jgi:hypothetical protein